MPPWTFGCSVTTRWPSMAGKPVISSVSETARPASRSALAVPPLERRSQPRSARPRPRSTTPALSYTESSALGTSDQLLDRLRVEPPLDVLDPLVQRVGGVIGKDGDRLLGQDRAGVDIGHRDVDRATGHLHPSGQRFLHRV